MADLPLNAVLNKWDVKQVIKGNDWKKKHHVFLIKLQLYYLVLRE